MKNAIKVNTILGIITFLLPVYPMEQFAFRRSEIKKVKNSNDDPVCFAGDKNNIVSIRDNRKFFTEENTVLPLATIQFMKLSTQNGIKVKKERKKILKTIGDTVSQGKRLASDFRLIIRGTAMCIECNCFGKKPTTVFDEVERWINDKKKEKNYDELKSKYYVNRNLVFEIIFKSADERKSYVNNGFGKNINDKLEINIPQVIIDVIFSLLHDEENAKFIKQAKE